MFRVCLCCAVLSVPCSLVVTCWERADLLALLCVVLYCVLSLSHTVFRVRCGTPGPKVKKLEFILKLKIKRNGWLIADTCPQSANHCALF